MKTVLIIGMSRFGHHLAKKMKELGNEVMIVDNNEEHVENLVNVIERIKIADCTNEEVLRSIGVHNFDICFVCIGTNFQASLEITDLLKECGAKYVISHATRDIHAKFLLKNGADEIIYPNRDSAERLATKVSDDNLYDYIELDHEYGIYEIPPYKGWIGKSMIEANIRGEYDINVIGIKNGEDHTEYNPSATYVINENDHLMIIGNNKVVHQLLKKIHK